MALIGLDILQNGSPCAERAQIRMPKTDTERRLPPNAISCSPGSGFRMNAVQRTPRDSLQKSTSEHREKAQYAFDIYVGIIKEIYEIKA